MIQGLLEKHRAAPPQKGRIGGLDPALPDGEYTPFGAPVLENIRCARGTWETRYGMSLWQTLPGAGATQHLANVYPIATVGTRFRLAVRGGQPYKIEAGVDATFQAIGAADLSATNICSGCQYADNYYLTDRLTNLRRFKAVAGAAAIARVLGPAKAAGLVAKPRTRRVLETWSGAAPYGWTQSSSADFDITDAVVDDPWPGPGNTVRIRCRTSSAKNKTISKDVAHEQLPSNTIAFYFKKQHNDLRITFEVGQNTAGEFAFRIKPPKANDWFIFYAQVGDLFEISYKRFRCINDSDVFKLNVGPLILPGMLDGQYRWRVSHKNSTTGQEGSPSDVSNAGVPLDLSALGVPYKNETDKALAKCASLTWTSDAGTDTTTDKVVIYRNGGVDTLTKDANGRDIWLQVAEVPDYSTTVGANALAGAGTLQLTVAGPVAAGHFLVLRKGTTTEEIVEVKSMAGAVATLVDPLVNAATVTVDSVQICYVDNTPNEVLDPLNNIELERDDPPVGPQWIAQSPDERLWIFGHLNQRDEVCVSNKRTVFRPYDHEVFPSGVDPLTRQDLLQGFRFRVPGEEIMWGGFFRGVPTILTRSGLYQVNAYSQQEWGPSAVVKVLRTLGCIAGETVAEINGTLYWVTDGPRVVAWDGSSAPQIISSLQVNDVLEAAPAAYWPSWFGAGHAKRDGAYYCLHMTPSGQTTNTLRLDYNADEKLWEPCTYYDASSALIPWSVEAIQDGSTDDRGMYAAQAGNGRIFRVDDATMLNDNGVGIRINFATKKYATTGVHKLERFFLRLNGVADAVTVTATGTASEYGTKQRTYTVTTALGTDEYVKRTHFDLKGRFFQFQVQGVVLNRPSFRDLEWQSIVVRQNRRHVL